MCGLSVQLFMALYIIRQIALVVHLCHQNQAKLSPILKGIAVARNGNISLKLLGIFPIFLKCMTWKSFVDKLILKDTYRRKSVRIHKSMVKMKNGLRYLDILGCWKGLGKARK